MSTSSIQLFHQSYKAPAKTPAFKASVLPPQSTVVDSLHFSGLAKYQRPVVEQAMALLSTCDDTDKRQFTHNVLMALDPLSSMPGPQRNVYRGMAYLYGRALGLAPNEIHQLSDLQKAFLRRADQVYQQAFEKVKKMHPTDFKAFAGKMRWEHGDNLFFYADKNGLGDKASALGQLVREVYWDEYSYSNGFFGYPSLHVAFLGCTVNDLLTQMTGRLVDTFMKPETLSVKYIENQLIEHVPQFTIKDPMERYYNPKRTKAIAAYVKSHYPELFKDIPLKDSPPDEENSAQRKAFDEIIRELEQLSIEPQNFYDLRVKKIYENLLTVATQVAYERDFSLGKPHISRRKIKVLEPPPWTEKIITPAHLSLEQKIQYMGHSYPEIYPDRWAILNHLFFVNGNGYEWVDGQLKNGHHEAKVIWYQNRKLTEPEFLALMEKPKFLPQESLLPFAPSENGRAAYPLCQYATIHHIPDDVKDEWLIAAAESLAYLVKHDPKQRKQGLEIYDTLQKRFADRGVLKPTLRDMAAAQGKQKGPHRDLLSLAGKLLRSAKWPNVKSLAGHILRLSRSKTEDLSLASAEMLSRAGYVLAFKRFVKAKSLAGYTLQEGQHQKKASVE